MSGPHLRAPKLEAFWRTTLSKWTKSGLNIRDFCQQHRIPEPSFYHWRREITARDQGLTSRTLPDKAAAPTRRSSKSTPKSFLKDFRGYLQADAFGGYDGLYSTGATEVACWAHARRKFVEAEPSDSRLSLEALALVRRLYDVERQAKELDSDNRLSLRQEKSVPVLRAIKEWLDARRASVLPKSPLGAAITYATNQWQALNVYLSDGNLAIDNNAAERALRGVAVGRKNWLFWGSDAGGKTAAVLTSFTVSCRRHGIDPWCYLWDVLARLPSHPADRVAELLPDTWAATQRRLS